MTEDTKFTLLGSTKLDEHVQMFARLCNPPEGRERNSVNIGFAGDEGDYVELTAAKCGVTVDEFCRAADDYLNGGCGIRG